MDKEIFDSLDEGTFGDNISTDKLHNLPSTEKLNENIVKYKTPIGRGGPIIGIFPIVLSDFEIDINCELKYKYPITSIKTLKNNIHISKFKFLDDNYKLLIEGYLSKTLEILKSNNIKKTALNIPFRTIVDIKYNTYPQLSSDRDSLYKKDYKMKDLFNDQSSLKINWKIENIRLYEKISTAENNNETTYKIIISLDILLIQNQKVFIPEPRPSNDYNNEILDN